MTTPPKTITQDTLAKVTGGASQGTSNNDSLLGTAAGDYIEAGNAQDTIDGAGGGDGILAGDGDDRARGGAGSDYIDGGSGQDRLFGNAGNDQIFGGDGDDTITGGTGHDDMDGGQGHDTFYWAPGQGSDTVMGGADRDTLRLVFATPAEQDRQFGVVAGEPNALARMLDGLLSRMTLDPGSARPSVVNGNEIKLDGVSGSITLGNGETIRFEGLERLLIDFQPPTTDPMANELT